MHLCCRQFIEAKQAVIDESWMLHLCCQEVGADGVISLDCSCLKYIEPKRNEKRWTMYWGHPFSGPLCILHLPRWFCTKCDQTIKPHPLTFQCWMSSYHTPTFWFDIEVMEQYRMLGPSPAGGTSARSFVSSIERVHQLWGLEAEEDVS